MKNKILKVPCLIYSRVVGYFQPVQNWHKGKQEEYKDRKTYDLKIVKKKLDE